MSLRRRRGSLERRLLTVEHDAHRKNLRNLTERANGFRWLLVLPSNLACDNREPSDRVFMPDNKFWGRYPRLRIHSTMKIPRHVRKKGNKRKVGTRRKRARQTSLRCCEAVSQGRPWEAWHTSHRSLWKRGIRPPRFTTEALRPSKARGRCTGSGRSPSGVPSARSSRSPRSGFRIRHPAHLTSSSLWATRGRVDENRIPCLES